MTVSGRREKLGRQSGFQGEGGKNVQKYVVGRVENPVAAIREQVSLLLAQSEPERLNEFRSFWNSWFDGEIPGNKVTVAAWVSDERPDTVDTCAQATDQVTITGRHDDALQATPLGALPDHSDRVIGIVRFWCSPYVGNKWFVEGLKVSSEMRRQGVAMSMLMYGIGILREMGVKELYAHIAGNNVPSIQLHQKLGFSLVSRGYVNSYGERRGAENSEYVLKL